MFPGFQSFPTRFCGELLLRGGRNLFLFTSKENRSGIELASQQILDRPTIQHAYKESQRSVLTFCCNAERQHCRLRKPRDMTAAY